MRIVYSATFYAILIGLFDKKKSKNSSNIKKNYVYHTFSCVVEGKTSSRDAEIKGKGCYEIVNDSFLITVCTRVVRSGVQLEEAMLPKRKYNL